MFGATLLILGNLVSSAPPVATPPLLASNMESLGAAELNAEIASTPQGFALHVRATRRRRCFDSDNKAALQGTTPGLLGCGSSPRVNKPYGNVEVPCPPTPVRGARLSIRISGGEPSIVVADAKGAATVDIAGPLSVRNAVIAIESDVDRTTLKKAVPIPASVFLEDLRRRASTSTLEELDDFSEVFPDVVLPSALTERKAQLLAAKTRQRDEAIERAASEARAAEERLAQELEERRIRGAANRKEAAAAWEAKPIRSLSNLEPLVQRHGVDALPPVARAAYEELSALVSETDDDVLFADGATEWIVSKVHPDTVRDAADKGYAPSPKAWALQLAVAACTSVKAAPRQFANFRSVVAVSSEEALVLTATRATFTQLCASSEPEKIASKFSSLMRIDRLPLAPRWLPPDLSLTPAAEAASELRGELACFRLKEVCRQILQLSQGRASTPREQLCVRVLQATALSGDSCTAALDALR